MGRGEVRTGQYLALNPGRVLGQLPGTPTQDTTFGLPATWIDASLREQAQTYGYTVVDASTVIATHLSQLLQTHAADLLGRDEVQQLFDRIGRDTPKLIEDLVPTPLPLGTVQRVLQNLLEEGVHIRDMRTIIEVLTEHGAHTQHVETLAAAVRAALGRAIIQDIYQNAMELHVIALDPALEHLLLQATTTEGGAGFEPTLAEKLLTQTGRVVQEQENKGLPPVLLVPAALRTLLSRFLRRIAPQLKVISHAEIPDTKTIKVTAVLGASA